MHYVVFVKQVPDTSVVKLDPVTNTLDRSSAPSIINPYDAHAVEEAVRLKQKYGGKVTVISMGPPMAVSTIKKCIELGADEGYLISDRAFAGSDTLATSYALTQALKKVMEKEPVDLIFAGKQAIDGDTAQVGPGVARRLGIPVLTQVDQIESFSVNDRTIRVQRKIEDGHEIVESKLPCLLTVEKEINELTYSPLPNMIRAAKYQPIVWTTNDIEVDRNQLGLKGSPTVVGKIFAPPKQSGGERIEGTADEKVAKVIDKLLNVHGLFAKEGV
ncbi:electron transfer flavoprotein subunit beta/FixA family protein [Tepidibacillus fermentans]|uniref:Electron transfer flavoprotein small subunit n=1 Tax=Tepidibacillus fermentans TaxID=1281767 RepID=A0A4R3KKB9_9BACI|nr:electron transfer flavoprotein subunit beta/FixA family protein [Tepidibacillus fermentans]TCS83691.1 electron transfer flavoprotein beta subunit [Tepidibacillus fermentans]